jgi:DNA-binding MarR family transcriptional regulator
MSGVRWLSEEEQQTWRSFLDASLRFFAAMDAQLQRDAGMPHAYFAILVRLSDAPDHEMRMSQLAGALAVSKSRVSHAVARLEERGWVRRVDCPTDRRGQLAQLTGEGYAALAAAAPGHVEHVRQSLFDLLTDEQLKQLRDICEAMKGCGRSSPAIAAACEPACADGEDELPDD